MTRPYRACIIALPTSTMHNSIVLQATECGSKYRRLGLAMLGGKPRREDYLFFGIEKTVVTLV